MFCYSRKNLTKPHVHFHFCPKSTKQQQQHQYRFNRQRKNSLLQGVVETTENHTNSKFVYYLGDAVYKWKLWGALIASATGLLLSFFTVLVHFDTIIAPRLWVRLFRDGSLFERNWILLLLLFWAGAVFVSTSTLSLGESQANAFFAAWFALASMAVNYKVWRDCAFAGGTDNDDLPHAVFRRETSRNWFWVAIFSFIFAVAATDMFFNRREIKLQYRGQTLDLIDEDWLIILVAVWAEVLVCLIAIAMNEIIAAATTYQVPFCNVIFVIGWRQLEVLVILLATGTKFYVILEYAAAVDGVISGLSNSYFGVWGSFLNSIFCLGTWLRENKDIEYFIREKRKEVVQRRAVLRSNSIDDMLSEA
jgi:hypothetical protein